jgi:hypothetical protein
LLGGGSGTGVDLYDCKARFKMAWEGIRAAHTDDDIATALRYAAASENALVRYYGKRGK